MNKKLAQGKSDDPAEVTPRRDLRPLPSCTSTDATRQLERERAAWAHEKEILLAMLAQQQRVAQAGLITSSLAHDIRNQIQMIVSTAEMSLISGDQSEVREALHSIIGFSYDVNETTESFLAFTRRQSSRDQQLFSLGEVIENCRRLVAPMAKTHGVTFHCSIDDDGIVQGERRMAIQAIVNLATNAVKACTDQESGEVTITASHPRPEICRITVADTGPGVPESVRARLFRPFVGTGGRSGGNGLGLFIVRQAVLELDGKIIVKTSPLGSTFRVDLPAVDETASVTGPVTGPITVSTPTDPDAPS